jgi:hypothetical protein
MGMGTGMGTGTGRAFAQEAAPPAAEATPPGHTMGAPEGTPPPEDEAPRVIDIDRGLALPVLEDEADLAPVLLREGAVITHVLGRVLFERATGAYVFVVDPADAWSPGHRFRLLPCSRLSELERILVSAPDYDLVFELTGDVYVYRQQNFLLPTLPPLLIDHEPKAEEPEEPLDPDSPEAIIADLQRSVGVVAHRPESDSTMEHAISAGAERIQAREGQTVISRRGRVRRDAGGAFVFVFDAGAVRGSDPSLILLPCLLLEEIEAYLQREGDDAPVLLNGRVYSFGRYDYVLPTVFRVPRERTKLVP